jgi:hypothetical protein
MALDESGWLLALSVLGARIVYVVSSLGRELIRTRELREGTLMEEGKKKKKKKKKHQQRMQLPNLVKLPHQLALSLPSFSLLFTPGCLTRRPGGVSGWRKCNKSRKIPCTVLCRHLIGIGRRKKKGRQK